MPRHREFIPITDPKLVKELQHKQSSLDALLAVSKSIIGNHSTLSIFKNFIATLKNTFEYTNIFFIYKTKTGWFVIHNNQHKHLQDLQLLDFLEPFTELTYLDKSEAVMGEFDTIVPVIHNDLPLAYLMVEGVHNQVIDSVQEEVRFLEAYTNLVVIAAENQRLLKQEIEQEYSQKELEMAAEIQQGLVPSSYPDLPCCEFDSRYIPHSKIGGDGFDVIHAKSKDAIFISMADVSGKGVSAALLMANFQATLATTFIHSTRENFAQTINKAVYRITKGERFVSLFACKIWLDENKITYINFGHNPPFFLSNGKMQRLDVGSTIIGVFEELPFHNIGEVTFEDEAQLLLFTDGLVDVTNAKDERFDIEPVEEILKDHQFKTPKEMNDAILKKVTDFKGKRKFNDDVTLLSVFLK